MKDIFMLLKNLIEYKIFEIKTNWQLRKMKRLQRLFNSNLGRMYLITKFTSKQKK